MARADPDTWQAHLAGVDALVNCAGVLQDSPRDSTKVHASGAAALFAACERAGFRRVIHFSAIGVDRVAPTDFSRSKLKGDQDLMARDLDWVILCVPLSWSVPPPSRPRRSGSVVAEDVRDLQSCAGRAGGASCRLCVPETQIPAPFSP